MSLKQLLADEAATLGTLATYLEGLGPQERWAELAALGRREQRALFQKAGQGPGITLEDLVPAQLPALTEVVHRGKNSLPLPGFLQRFEKRFCRPDDGSLRLFGFNEGLTRPLIGPGYFVAVPTAGNKVWEERGAVVVDYFQVPERAVAQDWPKVRPNSRGLQFFVFHRTRDFMRKVSAHVSIGAAYKMEKELDHYFVLCREP